MRLSTERRAAPEGREEGEEEVTQEVRQDDVLEPKGMLFDLEVILRVHLRKDHMK